MESRETGFSGGQNPQRNDSLFSSQEGAPSHPPCNTPEQFPQRTPESDPNKMYLVPNIFDNAEIVILFSCFPALPAPPSRPVPAPSRPPFVPENSHTSQALLSSPFDAGVSLLAHEVGAQSESRTRPPATLKFSFHQQFAKSDGDPLPSVSGEGGESDAEPQPPELRAIVPDPLDRPVRMETLQECPAPRDSRLWKSIRVAKGPALLLPGLCCGRQEGGGLPNILSPGGGRTYDDTGSFPGSPFSTGVKEPSCRPPGPPPPPDPFAPVPDELPPTPTPTIIDSPNFLSVHLPVMGPALREVFFYSHVSQRLEQASDFERSLFAHIMLRKFMPAALTQRSSCNLNLELRLTPQAIQELMNSPSVKRPEECYKFVLTRVIKHLKRPFSDSNEDLLYSTYFGETARQAGLSLDWYKYPLTHPVKGRAALNSAYFARIFQSAPFVEAMTAYMDGQFIQDYEADILSKLDFMLGRWEVWLAQTPGTVERVEAEILQYIISNRRCKLPWTLREVREALRRFRGLVTQHSPKKSTDTTQPLGL